MLLGPFQMGRNSERLIVGPPEQVDACGALGLMKVRRGMPMQRGHRCTGWTCRLKNGTF